MNQLLKEYGGMLLATIGTIGVLTLVHVFLGEGDLSMRALVIQFLEEVY